MARHPLLLLVSVAAAFVCSSAFLCSSGTTTNSLTATRIVDEAAAASIAKDHAGADAIKLPAELADFFGADAGERAPLRRAQGPVASHRDRIFATEQQAGIVSLVYLNVTGPPADFVLTDSTTGEIKTLKIVPGLAVKYDNDRFLHRVDAPEASTRMMIGPTSRTAPGETFKPVGSGLGYLPEGPCGTGGIQEARMMAVEHPEPPAILNVRVPTLVAIVFISGFALGGLLAHHHEDQMGLTRKFAMCSFAVAGCMIAVGGVSRDSKDSGNLAGTLEKGVDYGSTA